MKKRIGIYFAISIFFFSGCSEEKNGTSSEEAYVTEAPSNQLELTFQETEEMDTAQPHNTEEGSRIVDESAGLELGYIQEMGYDDNIGLGGPVKSGDSYIWSNILEKGYACWNDWLIIGDDVYKKQEDGRYKWQRDLGEIFGTSYANFRQYRNLIISADTSYKGPEGGDVWFLVYDLDAEEMVELEHSEEPGICLRYEHWGWYVFGGKIYYRPSNCKSIRTINLSSGENREFYCPDEEGKKDYMIQDFIVREDGSVAAVLRSGQVDSESLPEDLREKRDVLGDNLPRHIEYWSIECSGDRIKETKIGETDNYESARIQAAQGGALLTCLYPINDELSMPYSFYLRESGEMEPFLGDYDELYLTEDGFYYFDSTEYPHTQDDPWTYLYHNNAISKYDLQRNKIKTYCLMEPSKLEEGWKLLYIYIYNSKATAFYFNEEEDYLYISQIFLD